jgi:AhpD family alkylhydroperoxidase
MSEVHHPEMYQRLQKLAARLGKQIPSAMSGVAQLHQQSLKSGELSGKIKELMALAVSICARCQGCVAYHVHDALKAGASHEEILETIGVALMMGGGPALIYGCEALQALEEFEMESQERSAA